MCLRADLRVSIRSWDTLKALLESPRAQPKNQQGDTGACPVSGRGLGLSIGTE